MGGAVFVWGFVFAKQTMCWEKMVPPWQGQISRDSGSVAHPKVYSLLKALYYFIIFFVKAAANRRNFAAGHLQVNAAHLNAWRETFRCFPLGWKSWCYYFPQHWTPHTEGKKPRIMTKVGKEQKKEHVVHSSVCPGKSLGEARNAYQPVLTHSPQSSKGDACAEATIPCTISLFKWQLMHSLDTQLCLH